MIRLLLRPYFGSYSSKEDERNPFPASLHPSAGRTEAKLIVGVGHFDQVVQETLYALTVRTDSRY